MGDPSLVFVVGIGRSGTSLLQNMLNAHSEVCFLPENSFLRRYFASGKFGEELANGSAQKLANDLAEDEAFKRLGFSASTLLNLLNSKDGQTADRFFLRVMLEYADDNKICKIIGDKDPRLIEFLLLLHSSFPGARVVHIYRDPRDVALSKTKAAWSKNRSFFANLVAGRVQWALVTRTGKALFDQRFHEVAYEDLISDPQEVLRRLCVSLDLEFETQMLSPEKGGRVLVATDEMPWKKESLGPILEGNKEKWRKGLTPVEIALSEAVSRKMMADAGYAVSSSWESLSIMQKSGVMAKALLASLLQPAYCRYRIWKQHTLNK